ncbi:MAG: MerR family transcriptional regulator [Methylotenera sp.]|nr:MerR family transcriptional regulator [Methylotenera sp.]NOT65043.1 MerR family transcriptional regulator [Methylotenera sp.]
MSELITKLQLPPIPAKRYFTIGEVSELCGVKPHVLRYWEQEFTQLKPVKRRGNRRYYQHHEVLLIRRIRELLYEQGFTISGARHRLDESNNSEVKVNVVHSALVNDSQNDESLNQGFDFALAKAELLEILQLLRPATQAG